MASVFGYAGSIAINYVVYCNWVVVKGWVVPRSATPPFPAGWSGAPALGRGLQCGAGRLVTSAFLVAGPAILNPLQRIPAGYDLLTEQAHIFAQISPRMVPIYYVIILTALWGTLNALPDIFTRRTHSFLRQLLPGGAKLSYRKVMNWFGGLMLLLTWTLVWSGTTPIFMIDLVALFSTNTGVGLACWAGLWFDTTLPAEMRLSRWMRKAAAASAIAISLMSLLSAQQVLGKYLNGD